MSADRAAAAQALAARCDEHPGAVLRDLLARLRDRSDDLVRVLAGESVRIELVITGWTRREVWVVLTPMGNVTAVTDQASLGADGRPHAMFRGDAEAVLRVVLGVTPLDQAVASGVFLPFLPVTRFSRLLRLVSEDLRALAAG